MVILSNIGIFWFFKVAGIRVVLLYDVDACFFLFDYNLLRMIRYLLFNRICDGA